MDKIKFEKLVDEALGSLPQDFKNRLENITVMVEDKPTTEVLRRMGIPPDHVIFGLYHGVPYTRRGSFYGNIPPDVIVIYQDPIVQYSASDEEIKQRVQDVVLHEVGHYFGLDEKDLRKIEKDTGRRKS
ncbi:metallopeptidase family protein [Acidobacteriota bacterium]